MKKLEKTNLTIKANKEVLETLPKNNAKNIKETTDKEEIHMNKKKMYVEAKTKTKNGITLIALIITIIVMLILVAAAMNLVVNGGLFKKAGQAVESMQNIINKEQELANGKIQVDGIWYDSIDEYISNIPSSDQEGNILTYTIKYDANGGNNAPANQIKTHGMDLTLSSTIPTRMGYTFKGWGTSNSATTARYQPGGKYRENNGTTLYAVWDINTHTITYDANGGSGAPEAQIKYYGINLILSNTAPTRRGYTFKGWGTSSSATTVAYQPGETYTANTGATLYAVWDINTYTITYDANGGSGEPENQIKTYGIDLTLSSTEPTRTGYTFKGWSINKSATTGEYQPGGTYAENNGATLYAVWEANTYTITYNGNGGLYNGKSTWSTNVKYGEGYIIEENFFTRTGYIFKGWNEKADGSGTDWTAWINKSWTWTYTKNVTLYAIWELETYTIKYNANGGSGEPGNQTKSYGIDLILSTTRPTRTGYTFKGWGTSENATTVAYQPGETYAKNNGATLYALWTVNTWVVTFNDNMFKLVNNTHPNGTTISYNSSTSILSLNNAAQVGVYDLYTISNLSFMQGDIYSVSLTYSSGTVSGPSVFVAEIRDSSGVVLSPRNYCDVNFPSSGTQTGTFTVSSNAALKGNKLRFWVYTDSDSTALYSSYKIKVNMTVKRTVTYGSTYGTLPPDPIKSGYTFAGWYTAASGGTKITSSSTVSINGNHTLYAHWTPNT